MCRVILYIECRLKSVKVVKEQFKEISEALIQVRVISYIQ